MQKIIKGKDAGSYVAVSPQNAVIVTADSDGYFLVSQTIGELENQVTNFICVSFDAMPIFIASLQEIKRRADLGIFDSRTIKSEGDRK